MKKLIPALIFVALLSVIIGVPLYATAAQLPCTLTIDTNGNISAVQCSGSVVPPAPNPGNPTPQPPAPPAPTTCPGVNPNAYPFMDQPGHNTKTYDYTQGGTVVTWRIPKSMATEPPQPVKGGLIQFASQPAYNPIGATYEVSVSKCPGDFTTYKQQAPTQGYYSCGGPPADQVGSFNFQQSWGSAQQITVCGVPADETWYLNWRCSRGLQGEPCGQTFYWSKSE